MSRDFLIATFSDPGSLLGAVHALRLERFRIHDVYAPYPIHGLDQAMGLRRSRLPWVALLVGVAAGLAAVLFQFYAAVFDWPLDVGGKPENSSLAFVPITFEVTVLLGGLAIVAALFLRARLYPGKEERLAAPGVTNDAFAIALRRRDSTFDAARASEVLRECGARQIEERQADL